MTQNSSKLPPVAGKGKAFFDRGDQVADAGNYDFAIEMYLEGIQREPENVDRGHKALWVAALARKAKGGKPAGMMDGLKRRQGKDPLTNLLNAEYMTAKDPGNLQHMELVLKASQTLELAPVTKWMAELMLEAQRQAPKPNMRVLRMLTDAFDKLQEYGSAVQAAEKALELDPDNAEIQSLVGQLGAKYTMKRGKYGESGSFTKGVADMAKQQELMKQDAMVQDSGYLLKQVEQARKDYEANPTVAGKINALVDALIKLDDESYENEAIDVLNKAHRDTQAYAFKMRIGDIKIKQMGRRYRKLQEQGDQQAAKAYAREILSFEIAEYTERAGNYPTDLNLKFELGRRLLIAEKYDDAIAMLQQAQRDPKRHVQSLTYLGQAFAKKNWFREASETFEKALATELPEEKAVELRYQLGTVLEQMNELQRAQDQFSQVAMVNFNYRDVRQRLEAIRTRLAT
jgi:tetratricopeptide (TPR) repeat protein